MFTKIFTPVLMKIYPCTVEEVRHNTQKEKRIIDTLEPVMNRHRLIFHDQVIKEDLKLFTGEDGTVENFKLSLFYQLTHITKDRGSLKHDDRLDALAMAVAYWVDAMGRDEDDAMNSYKEQQLEESLRAFMEEGLHVRPKNKPQGSCWFNV